MIILDLMTLYCLKKKLEPRDIEQTNIETTFFFFPKGIFWFYKFGMTASYG